MQIDGQYQCRWYFVLCMHSRTRRVQSLLHKCFRAVPSEKLVQLFKKYPVLLEQYNEFYNGGLSNSAVRFVVKVKLDDMIVSPNFAKLHR